LLKGGRQKQNPETKSVSGLRPFGLLFLLNDLSVEESVMAKACAVCGKRPVFGNQISHAHNVSSRRWFPNLQRVRAIVDGTVKRINVCTRCIRSGKVQKAAR